MTTGNSARTDTAPTLLFVCARNGGKSQMAAALATLRSEGGVTALSAGTNPGSKLNAQSVESIAEVGGDMSAGHPKALDPEVLRTADRVVVLGTEAKVEPVEGMRARIETWETDEPSTRGIE
uniref:arsenate-mycothiol transferase ArsC n=1 Tax=Brevibacterium litoralis TaxID=3138935 RepID=UPI0032ED485F